MMSDELYEVAVIGAGAVGAAIARELSRYALRCVLLEAGPDVGMGTSKASTAIWHTGFDATPGSLEARLLTRGYALLRDFMPQANIPMAVPGGLLIAWNDDQRQALPSLLQKAHKNGVTDAHLVEVDEIYRREPRLAPGAQGGMFVPGEGILCTYTLPLAYANQAVLNGVTLRLDFPVARVASTPDGHLLEGPGGSVRARFVVNAAGLHSDTIDRLFGQDGFTVTPRRGELIVFDKRASALLRHILLPVPTAVTKGVLVSPTVYGNVLLGPTAENLPDKTATHTTADGLNSLLEKGRAILPSLLDEEVTALYAGLRAATEHSDFQIRLHSDQRYVCVGGIRSTGVSASLGIAEHVVELLESAGLARTPRAEFVPVVMPPLGENQIRPYRSAAKIADDPDFGRIVCHCEYVTLGEIREALRAPIPARTIDGLRRRTRVLQGRCQGFNCYGAVVAQLAEATGQSPRRLMLLEDGDVA